MSAWVCSNEHINYLVSAAQRFDRHHEIKMLPVDLGRLLLRENVRSVLHRYGPETVDADEVTQYAEQVDAYRHRQIPVEAVAALKLLHSWQYQTCETPDYASTEAWLLSRKIEALCVRALPGYSEAAWSL